VTLTVVNPAAEEPIDERTQALEGYSEVKNVFLAT
jgi:hypothetical protein